MAGNELADRRRRVGMAIVHEVAGTVVFRRHHRQERRVLERLDLHADPHLGEVGVEQRDQVHVARAAGAHLHLEAEPIDVTGFGEQRAGLVGVMSEEFLDGLGHLLEGLVVVAEARVLGVGHEFGMAAVEQVDDLLLVHGHVQRAPDADVVERRLVHAHGDEVAGGGEPARPLEFGRRLLQVVHGNPADRFEDVDLGGANGREVGRLVLDDAVFHAVHEGHRVVAPADAFAVPVVGVPGVGVRIALDVPGQFERPGADHGAPVLAVHRVDLARHDERVVAVAEAVGPLGIELVEAEHDGVVVARLDGVEVVPVVALGLLGAVVDQVERIHDVVRVKLPCGHDPGTVHEHDPAAQMDHQRAVVFPLPAFREFPAQGIVGNVRLGDEPLRTALVDALVEVRGEQLLANQAVVVVALPRPIHGIPGQRGQRDVDRADVQGAAVARLGARFGDGGRAFGRAGAEHGRRACGCHESACVHHWLPRMRGSRRSRKASP